MERFKAVQFVVGTKSGARFVGDFVEYQKSFTEAQKQKPDLTDEEFMAEFESLITMCEKPHKMECFNIYSEGDRVNFNPKALEYIKVRIQRS